MRAVVAGGGTLRYHSISQGAPLSFSNLNRFSLGRDRATEVTATLDFANIDPVKLEAVLHALGLEAKDESNHEGTKGGCITSGSGRRGATPRTIAELV